jgi:non-ribosomal peptide synthetase component F
MTDSYDGTFNHRISITFGSTTDEYVCLDGSNVHCEWQLLHDTQALKARIHFASDLFSPSTIYMFANVYSRVLTAFATEPSAKIITLPLCDSIDLKRIEDWNNTYRKPLEFSSIGDMFRHWAGKIPDALAVENGDGSLSLTYRQLDNQSDALASWLIAQGYGGDKETIIGVWQIRSAALVMTYLACLKAGCAYMVSFLTASS